MVTHTALETAKNFVDGISVAAVLATLAAWLPPAAAFVSLVWGCIRIYETKTVQGWMKKRHKTKTRRNTAPRTRPATVPDSQD